MLTPDSLWGQSLQGEYLRLEIDAEMMESCTQQVYGEVPPVRKLGRQDWDGELASKLEADEGLPWWSRG